MKLEQVRRTREMLVRHRFGGKFGWHYLPTGGRRRTHEFRSAGDEVIRLDTETATDIARQLERGEVAWFELSRDVQVLVQDRSTLGDKLRYLETLGSTLQRHPPKNRALATRLTEASVLGKQARQLEYRAHRRATQLAEQAIAQVAALLSGRKRLVLLVAGMDQPRHRFAEEGPALFTPAAISNAVKTWAIFPGFTADTCGECGATVNVLADCGAWFCECGHMNLQAFHEHQIPHETPDYGPEREDIILGVHANCKENCSCCHGKIRLPAGV